VFADVQLYSLHWKKELRMADLGVHCWYAYTGNARGEKMEMTTPVFTNTRGDMQFVIGKAAHQVSHNCFGAPVLLRRQVVWHKAFGAESGDQLGST
jgi:hypothetical protein